MWTAMDILTAYATKKGWVTAQAGRPDVHRAGNAILRALAEGRIRWAFWPPGTPTEVVSAHQEEGCGIWIAQEIDETEEDTDEEYPARDGWESEVEDSEPSLDEDADEDEDEDAILTKSGVGGRFSALSLDDTVLASSSEDE